ncbi:OLC1v1013357C2 [Oldenlandia corymbosa var. corymbosa]|uniref:galactinol--sucrose galactosyltransferase n=1 Tax=Oldenlandia corymbosa var. corymbosa TaxID=529605 RepID=A0AAV1DYI0_OLDCO|nr:OLC1v1013357C2 [Oldenlandia corymbosa var. corymbosa]
MTVTSPCIKDGSLMVNGKVLINRVPPNITVSPIGSSAAYVGATSSVSSSKHVFSLGFLKEYRFMCLYRFKIWWMQPCTGSVAREIPIETQMLLLEVTENSEVAQSEFLSSEDTFYVLLLPLLDGRFRASLQGSPADELKFCIDSEDVNVQTNRVAEAVFINWGDNPFMLIKDSIKILEVHKTTFAHIDHKKKPAHLDWFGWCTWDAFYLGVDPIGIKKGLQGLKDGGFAPRFLIIDDGWQDLANEFHNEDDPPAAGSQFGYRLVDFKESSRFMRSGGEIGCYSLHDLVKSIKEDYGLKYVYVWHALVGYWGGVLPSSEKMKQYNPKITYPKQSPGNKENIWDGAMESLEKFGIGLVDPDKIYDFYNDYHAFLASCCVDGVKVDVQNILETLGSGHGGRISLTQKYQQALEESIARNFKENNLICCMSHNSDSIYSSKRSATARASEDFMPREPKFQTIHVASVAYNSLLLGEIVVPDWDMFQSKHDTAEFHAAARALGGCPVYVSDKPGSHDFEVLKKLVLPDGSVLRAKCAGRPTRDCLFVDPVGDGKSMLKIWNVNPFSGILGVFNCQGCGNWHLREEKQNASSSISEPVLITSQVSPTDIDSLGEIAGEQWGGDCAVYTFRSGSLTKIPKEGKIDVSLDTLQWQIFTISPVMVVTAGLEFAPIGLIDMYNSGGATHDLKFISDHSDQKVCVEVRGCGRFGSYSSRKPTGCLVDGKDEEFQYHEDDGLLVLELKGEGIVKNVEIYY